MRILVTVEPDVRVIGVAEMTTPSFPIWKKSQMKTFRKR